MGIIDLVILALLTLGAIKGWISGFFKQLVSLLGFVVGLIVAVWMYAPLGAFIVTKIDTTQNYANIIAFLIIWMIVPLLMGIVASLLTKTASVLKLGILNRVAGMLFGVFKLALIISCILNLLNVTQVLSPEQKRDSKLYNPICGLAKQCYEHFQLSQYLEETQKRLTDALNDTDLS